MELDIFVIRHKVCQSGLFRWHILGRGVITRHPISDKSKDLTRGQQEEGICGSRKRPTAETKHLLSLAETHSATCMVAKQGAHAKLVNEK